MLLDSAFAWVVSVHRIGITSFFIQPGTANALKTK